MYFLGFDISGIILVLKIIGAVLSFAFFVAAIISFISFLNIREKKQKRRANYFIKYDGESREETENQKRWLKIKKHFQSKNPAEWRVAIIDADSMLEDIITSLGYSGDTFGEKLKNINRDNFPAIDDIWKIHILRNKLAHEGSNYHLSEREVYQTFRIYEQIFYDTGYIT